MRHHLARLKEKAQIQSNPGNQRKEYLVRGDLEQKHTYSARRRERYSEKPRCSWHIPKTPAREYMPVGSDFRHLYRVIVKILQMRSQVDRSTCADESAKRIWATWNGRAEESGY